MKINYLYFNYKTNVKPAYLLKKGEKFSYYDGNPNSFFYYIVTQDFYYIVTQDDPEILLKSINYPKSSKYIGSSLVEPKALVHYE